MAAGGQTTDKQAATEPATAEQALSWLLAGTRELRVEGAYAASIGLLQVAAGQSEAARASLARALGDKSSGAELLLAISRAATHLDDRDLAVQAAARAVLADPSLAASSAWPDLGVDADTAIADALAQAHEAPLAEAQIRHFRGDWETAERLYRSVLAHYPLEASFGLGCLHLNANDPAEAERYLEAARRIAPHEPSVRAALALALARLGEIAAADRVLLEARRMYLALASRSATPAEIDRQLTKLRADFPADEVVDPPKATPQPDIVLQAITRRYTVPRYLDAAQFPTRQTAGHQLELDQIFDGLPVHRMICPVP